MRRRCASGCATGASPASATGAARSRSSTATTCGAVPVPDDQLPVVLPDVDDYPPEGKGAARRRRGLDARAVSARAAGPGRREAETMDTFVDSSWYFMRYCDPKNSDVPWTGISSTGGPRRPVYRRHRPPDGHLLYSRFFVKAMNDWGLLGFREPFAAAVLDQGWVQLGGTKMSKTKGNSSAPTTSSTSTAPTRCGSTILFMGPADQDMEWTDDRRSRGSSASCAGCGALVHEVAERAPADGPARERRSRARRTRRSRR